MNVLSIAIPSFLLGISFHAICTLLSRWYKSYTISHRVKQADYYRPCTECTITDTSEIGYKVGPVVIRATSDLLERQGELTRRLLSDLTADTE